MQWWDNLTFGWTSIIQLLNILLKLLFKSQFLLNKWEMFVIIWFRFIILFDYACECNALFLHILINILCVMQHLDHYWIVSLELFKNMLDFLKVLNKNAVQKACTLIEDIVVWCWIKLISLLRRTIRLNLLFYHKSHVAEWKCKVFLDDHPIMILAIKPTPSTIGKFIVRITVYLFQFI